VREPTIGASTSSWPGHWTNKAGNWYAKVEAPISPPSVFHFCAANCFTLTLEGGRYVRADGSDETWTIESFTRGSVILHRHAVPAEWNGYSRDLPYKGHVSGETFVSETIGGKPDAPATVKMPWGSALNTLPGSNAERDRGKPSTGPHCDRPPGLLCAVVFLNSLRVASLS
jgi:hypothetical protein